MFTEARRGYHGTRVTDVCVKKKKKEQQRDIYINTHYNKSLENKVQKNVKVSSIIIL
jgi:hypothetical protein